MVLKRKLTDLYVRGKEVELDDGQGEPITVFVRKITPVDAEEAYRAANAARARVLSAKGDPQEPIHVIVSKRCEAFGVDEMIDALAMFEVQTRRPVIEAELEAEERWSKDDYLQGLHDAWEGGLKEKHTDDPPDPEAERVFAEMQKFTDELEKRVAKEEKAIVKDLKTLSEDEIRDRFFESQFERESELEWLTEYRRQELYFAVRDPDDHSEKAFESAREVEQAMPSLVEKLRNAYNEISIDIAEGKD